jgi:hypothetical protein
MAKSTRALRCPVCGGMVTFSVYQTTIRVENWVQTMPQRFVRDSINPSKLDTVAAPMMVCSGCAHPIGPVPIKAIIHNRKS